MTGRNAKLKGEPKMKKPILFTGLIAVALLVSAPINAGISKNKAFTMCKQEVKAEYTDATKTRLRNIKDRSIFRATIDVYSPSGKQKVECELNKSSGAITLTEV
tara:strand:- start:57 stop:368 length:312 start_codon:yes stop_codon:yes gene_type:complete